MASALLKVTGLACRRGGRHVFGALGFALDPGVLLALEGRNGSGKTTLLRALALLVPAEAGAIYWQGDDVRADRDAWRSRIAWLGHLDGLKGDLSVRENLVVAQRLRGADETLIDSALAAFDLQRLGGRAVRTLSAGQRRRTALARVAGSRARLWLLDEPLNALDAPARAALHAALSSHLSAGGLAIAATHAELGIAGTKTLELGVTQ